MILFCFIFLIPFFISLLFLIIAYVINNLLIFNNDFVIFKFYIKIIIIKKNINNIISIKNFNNIKNIIINNKLFYIIFIINKYF